MDDTRNTFDNAKDRLNDAGTDTHSDVEADVEEGQSLINEAKEMARRDWENQYDDSSDDGAQTGGADGIDPSDLEAEIGGTFDDAQGDVDSSVSGARADLGGTIGDPSSDFDSEIHNKQAGLGGAIGVPDDSLGGTAGDDQIDACGAFGDARGGVGSASVRSSNESDAGLVSNDLQGAVDMNPAGDETRIEGEFGNVETTLSGGLGDEQSGSGSKFDSVRSEVERNFSDVAGVADTGVDNAGCESTSVTDDIPADSGDLRFNDAGVVDDADSRTESAGAGAVGLGERARNAGMDLKARAQEAREEAGQRLGDVRREVGGGGEHASADGKSMVEDVQDKAKGLLNKVKDVFDGHKKS